MKTVTAPASLGDAMPSPIIFLAGGITGCPDWQKQALDHLADDGFTGTTLNPRRADFDVTDPNAAPAQILWEHYALRHASVIMFWFAAEQIQPIALYELGAWSITPKSIAVGCDSAYPRRVDVLEQTRLVRPELEVADSLEATVKRARGLAEALPLHFLTPLEGGLHG
jgi:hypothetical protein